MPPEVMPCQNEARESGLCYYCEKVKAGLMEPSLPTPGGNGRVLMKKVDRSTKQVLFERTKNDVRGSGYNVDWGVL